MNKKFKTVINSMNKETNEYELTKYENQLISMIMAPILFVAGIIGYVLFLIFDPANASLYTYHFFAFMLSSFLIYIVSKLKINSYLASVLLSVVFVLITQYIFFTLYEIFSYVVWIIMLLQLVFAYARIKKHMVYLLSINFVFTTIFAWMNPEKFSITPSWLFYVSLLISFIVMLIILHFVGKVNTERYFRIVEKANSEIEQKEEITALYEEIAASEEELREKNEQLKSYNHELEIREGKLNTMAYYDKLTGLPNRTLIMDSIKEQISISKNEQSKFYIVYIDVDAFKKVNDSLGHHVGDEFLKYVSKNIKKKINKKDMLGRLGGDEFALLIRRDVDKNEVEKEIDEIRMLFQKPFLVRNVEIVLSASFGVSIYPENGETTSKLIKYADMSMYNAKEAGKNKIRFFNKKMMLEFMEDAKLEGLLATALDRKEFHLVYQPQYNGNGTKVRGFEALLRWKSPELGSVSPAKFIPKAEETRVIIPIGEWVLREACTKLAKLRNEYGNHLTMSINISMVQLKDDNFALDVKRIIDESNVNPENIELEITESEATENWEDILNKLEELKKTGVVVALDDFGTGYSSLNHLKRMPIDILKIDKSFIDDMNRSEKGRAIVKDIISLVHNLGLKVVAEGVEESLQLSELDNYGCDYLQGFLLSMPLEEKYIEKLFKK